MTEMIGRTACQIVALIAPAFLVAGCYTFSTSVSLSSKAGPSEFTVRDEEVAIAVVVDAAERFGLMRTPHAERLRSYPPTDVYPYEALVTLGGATKNPHVSVLGEINEDRTVMRFAIWDLEHGRPTSFTNELMEALRTALSRAFPDHRLEVTQRRKFKLFSA